MAGANAAAGPPSWLVEVLNGRARHGSRSPRPHRGQRERPTHEPGGRAPPARAPAPGREQQQNGREHGDRDHPDPVGQPRGDPPARPGPRRRDQRVQPVLMRKGTQPQPQARRQQQPADPVPGPPGRKHNPTTAGDRRLPARRRRRSASPTDGTHHMPVHVRQRQPASYQRDRRRRHAASHPPGRPDPHTHPPGTDSAPVTPGMEAPRSAPAQVADRLSALFSPLTPSASGATTPHHHMQCCPARSGGQADHPTSSSSHPSRSPAHPSPADRHRIAFGNAGAVHRTGTHTPPTRVRRRSARRTREGGSGLPA